MGMKGRRQPVPKLAETLRAIRTFQAGEGTCPEVGLGLDFLGEALDDLSEGCRIQV